MAEYILLDIEISPSSSQDHEQVDIGYYELDIDQEESDQEEIVFETLESEPEEKYLLILVQHAGIKRLANSDITLMSDCEFNTTSGQLKLVGRVVYVKDSLCNQCGLDNCLHMKAYSIALEDSCFQLSYTIPFGTSYLYTFSHKFVCVLNDSEVHIYKLRENKWYCTNCTGTCPELKVVIEYHQTFETQVINHEYHPSHYTTVTNNPIPLTFSEDMTVIYRIQMSEGIKLPEELISLATECPNGFRYQQTDSPISLKGVIAYTESDIISLPDHKVYRLICDGPCLCESLYQGHEHLLNINNRYLVHYGLLYEYSELMRAGRNPLYAFVSAKNNKLRRMGSSILLKYHIIYLAWNYFLMLVDIKYGECFVCPLCSNSPNTIILDGITLGTIKELPVEHLPRDQNISQYVPISKRLWIPHPRLRKSLQAYVKDGLSPHEFTNLLADLEPESFQAYVGNSYSSLLIGGVTVYRPNNQQMKYMLKYLASTEPLAGIFQFPILNEEELIFVMNLASGQPGENNQIELLYAKMPNLKTLFTSYDLEILHLGLLRLHTKVSSLLSSYIEHIEYLYTRKTRKVIPMAAQQNFQEYLPAFNQYSLPTYESDYNEYTTGCKKVHPKHKILSPGMITISCPHGICYGFKILTSGESTIIIFNILIGHFAQQPKYIIYDNACNLHKTCLIGDPTVFRKSTFLIDRFHSTNHKCNPGYSMRNIRTRDIQTINSQVCEQLYSRLRRISSQLAYMKVENIFYTTRFF